MGEKGGVRVEKWEKWVFLGTGEGGERYSRKMGKEGICENGGGRRKLGEWEKRVSVRM